ncbi:MAG: glycosyltransferase family 4 protein [Anaerolineales bacterium]|nr:glycosyltransferase family 4 protein [Anaerolineales bacterium]
MSARRLRIAYFSPLPPARSGIADYSRELLPALADHADLALFTAQPASVDAALRQQFPVQPLAAYAAQRWQFDLPLYQMGNSMHHDALYDLFTRFPGVLVLHDYVLHHFMAHRAQGKAGYTRELGYALGPAGIDLAWQIRAGKRPSPLYDLPLNDRLLDLSLGTVVHSDYVASLIRAARPDHPLRVIPALVADHPGRRRRAELGWPDDAIVFASVGQVTPSKHVDRALRAFRLVRQSVPQARFLLVGELLPDVDLATGDLGDSFRSLGYVESLAGFVDWIHTADVVVNLRHPTAGETSATALRALAAGKPLLVYDQGWYAELPAAAAVKLPPDDEAALAAAMLQLAAAPSERQRLGAAARAYVQQHCLPDQVAARLARFLQDTLTRLSG